MAAMASSITSIAPCPCACAPSVHSHNERASNAVASTSCLPNSVENAGRIALRTRCGRGLGNECGALVVRRRERRGGGWAVRAFEMDQDTLVAISVAVAGLAVGIGVPIFYETQVKGAESRENDQPCFPCKGTGSQTCRFCVGAGSITVELGAGEREVSKCINCEGSGSLTCTTCQGSGVQPRYLDRREYKDDD